MIDFLAVFAPLRATKTNDHKTPSRNSGWRPGGAGKLSCLNSSGLPADLKFVYQKA
jgi:hypothetical protein